MNVLPLCNLSFLKFIFPKLGIDQGPDAIAFTSRLNLSLVHYERFHNYRICWSELEFKCKSVLRAVNAQKDDTNQFDLGVFDTNDVVSS